MGNSKKYFCPCGHPIDANEDFCIDCSISSQDKYKYLSEESYTWYLTDDLAAKYINSENYGENPVEDSFEKAVKSNAL